MLYNKAYFIAKFEAVPVEKWATGTMAARSGKSCALGHCGVSPECDKGRYVLTDEATALVELLSPSGDIWDVINLNDDPCGKSPRLSPKERILAALRDCPE